MRFCAEIYVKMITVHRWIVRHRESALLRFP